MSDLRRKYSAASLAQAGALIRMEELHEEIAYLEAFLARSAYLDHDKPRRRRRVKSTLQQEAPVVSFTVEEPEPQPQVGNGFSVSLPGRNGRGRRPHGPDPSVTLTDRVTAIVYGRAPAEMTPGEVLRVLEGEAWVFNDEPLHSVQAALRRSHLERRKEGVY